MPRYLLTRRKTAPREATDGTDPASAGPFLGRATPHHITIGLVGSPAWHAALPVALRRATHGGPPAVLRHAVQPGPGWAG